MTFTEKYELAKWCYRDAEELAKSKPHSTLSATARRDGERLEMEALLEEHGIHGPNALRELLMRAKT